MNNPLYGLILLVSLVLFGCEKDPIRDTNIYSCSSILPQASHPESARFDKFLQNKVNQGIPGISMLIQTPEGLYHGAAGLADIPNKIPMKSCHLHRIGSITKQFTSAIILRLYQDGLLTLEDKASALLPASISKNLRIDRVSIRHLLTHSSGIPDVYDIDFWLDFYNEPSRVFSPEEELKYLKGLELEFAPGSFWNYSNSNYIILQIIAEQVSGKSFEELLFSIITNPLGLYDTSFDADGIQPEQVVRGYTDAYGNNELTDVTDYGFGLTNGTGGIFSTPYELLQFHKAFTKADRLFNEETLKQIFTITPLPFFEPNTWDFGEENKVSKVSGIGMGWLKLDTKYGPAYGHNGGLMGRKARAWYFPQSDYHMIYFINADGGKINDLSREIFRNEMVELLFE